MWFVHAKSINLVMAWGQDLWAWGIEVPNWVWDGRVWGKAPRSLSILSNLCCWNWVYLHITLLEADKKFHWNFELGGGCYHRLSRPTWPPSDTNVVHHNSQSIHTDMLWNSFTTQCRQHYVFWQLQSPTLTQTLQCNINQPHWCKGVRSLQ